MPCGRTRVESRTRQRLTWAILSDGHGDGEQRREARDRVALALPWFGERPHGFLLLRPSTGANPPEDLDLRGAGAAPTGSS